MSVVRGLLPLLLLWTLPGGVLAQAFPDPGRGAAPALGIDQRSEASRDQDREAQQVFEDLMLQQGTQVADLHAGGGYYTVRLARALGPLARIFAVSGDPARLQLLGQRLEQSGMQQVQQLLGAPDDPGLPPRSVSLAILADGYHEIPNPYAYFYRLAGSLIPGGRLAVVEADRPIRSGGAPPDLLRCELAAVGYRQVDFRWLLPSEDYLAVFSTPDSLPAPETIRPCGE